MQKIIIIYFSKSRNTQKMAKLIAEGINKSNIHDLEVELKQVNEAKLDDLLAAAGIIIGSPTYYGTMAAEIKEFIDKSIGIHGKLIGKIGGAFTSSGGLAGGNETTILDILKSLLIHGMIIQGSSSGDHYGPVAIGKPDKRSKKQCIEYGRKIARLVEKLQ